MGEPQPIRLTLASASPARRELLQRLGVPFEVRPAYIDEPEAGFRDPRTMVQMVSWLKAAAVAPSVENGLVLAADTIGEVPHPLLVPVDRHHCKTAGHECRDRRVAERTA